MKTREAIKRSIFGNVTVLSCVPFIVFFLVSTLAIGQVTITNTGNVMYFVGTSVYVNGSYVNAPTAPTSVIDPQIWLNSPLYISENVVSNGVLNLIDENNSSSFLELNGTVISSINGGAAVTLNLLRVNKAAGLILNNNLSIRSNSMVLNPQVELILGNIDLQSFEIDLGLFGFLSGENDSRRVLSSSSGVIRSTLNMSPLMTDNPGGLGFQLEGSILAGVEIRRGHSAQTTAGDGGISRYYDVNLNGGDVVNTIRLNYLTPELNGIPEGDLSIYISFNGGTTWEKIGGTVNTTLNYVELTGLNISGNFRVTLSDKDCVSPPLVDLGLPTQNLCAGNSINLDAGNPGSSYLWSTTETTQVISVSTAGTYSVTVTDPKGCTGFDTVDLIERPSPVAAFTNSISCEGESMSFTNGSSISSGTLTYQWDFGDPSTTTDNSTVVNPTYTYPIYNTYSVSLIATSDFNCATTLVKNVTAFPIPVVDFSSTPGCLGSATNFTNLSSVPIGGMTYEWDFGDGNTSAQTNPSNSFGTIADYSVSLIATSNANCVNSVSKLISVNHTPISSFSTSDICEQVNLSLVNNSTITSGSLNYNWDFGDGTSSTDLLPVKSYSSSGPYTITLTVTSDANCTDVATQPITIFQKPVAMFLISDDCQNKTFNFSNASTSGQGALTYLWDFGDGETSTNIDPSKDFSSPGNFNVSLLTTTSFGCTDQQITNLEVFPVPQTNFSFNDVCQDIAASFNNSTSIATGSFTSQWDFGDSNSSIASDPSHNYAASGIYTVQLEATSDKGCQGISSADIEIFSLPIIDLGGVISTCGISYVLDAENPGSTYLWSDGSTQQQLTVTQNGVYSVVVTTANSCVASEMVDITLKGEVIPNLGADLISCGPTNLDAGFPGSTYLWTTGEVTRVVDITSTSTYGVTVTDQNGCLGYDEVFITVNPLPVVELGSDQIVCADQQVILDAGGDGVSYSWSNGSTGRTIGVVTSGTYSVNVINTFNCETIDQVDIVINPLPNLPFAPTINVCDQITLNANNIGSSYLWSDGSTLQTLEVTSSGNYSVEITTTEGCRLQVPTNVTVSESPQVDLGPDIQLCFGESATLNGGNQGDSYLWSTGGAGSTEVVSQTAIYWVDAIRTNGCVTRDSVNVTVYPDIVNELQASYVLCVNKPLLLEGFSPQGVSYLWRSDAGFLGSASSIQVSQPDRVWLTTTNSIGCEAVDTVVVNSDPDPIQARFLAATFVNVGDSVRFIQFAAPDPVSFDWNFDDGLTSTESDPTHIYLRPADFDVSLTVTDPNSCQDTEVKAITVRLLRDQSSIELEFPFVELVDSKLYPNPVSSALSVEVQLNRTAAVTVGLYSLAGILLKSHTDDLSKSIIDFDLQDLPAGVYLIKVFVNNQARTMRFVKI